MILSCEQQLEMYSHNTGSQYSPLNKRSQQSPHKLSSSVNLSQRSHHKFKTEISPRKQQQYSIHHENKLKVFVKFRPPTAANSKLLNVSYLSPSQVQIQRQSTNNKVYTFDRVYHHSVPSPEVFATGCKDVIDDCLSDSEETQGRKNGLIFVYGHTGTGKTHTMGLIENVGKNSKGIVPQALRYIFSETKIVKVGLSFSEIYMDEIYDMLDFENDKKLAIREHQTTKEPYVENQILITINSAEEAYQLINIGLEKRRIAEQRVNKRSSRGHGIITLNICTAPSYKESRICFVDLAGSERVKESESSGKTLTEAVHINTSLSALETLLMNIGQQSVRMYRGNKLTRLLQPFLESGKIRLFVTSNYENIQPIDFAKRCKGIKFMEREVIDPKASTFSAIPVGKQKEASKKMQDKIDTLQSLNKNLLYCVSNMLGLFNKISQLMNSSLDAQHTHSNFSLSETFSIKNEQIQNKVNAKIHKLEAIQEQIMDKEMPSSIGAHSTSEIADNLSEISTLSTAELLKNPSHLLSLVKDSPNQLMKKVHEIGFSIFQSIKQLSNLTEYRNIYKKQVFSSELKACLLQTKNGQFETAINLLLKNFQKQSQVSGNTAQIKKIMKELNEIGVAVGGTGYRPQKSTVLPESKSTKKTVPHTSSTSSSSVKANNSEIRKKNLEKTPTKSAQEEYNQFLPFSNEHTREHESLQLFKGENTNYSNHQQSRPSKRQPNAGVGKNPLKETQSPKKSAGGMDLQPTIRNNRKSLILIEDL